MRDGEGAACFPTHDGLTLIAGVWPSRRFEEIRSDVEGQIAKVHRSAPSVRGPAPERQREEKWTGTAGVANYFRKPYGSGWALVGDAGYDKDPLTAQGISDAFADAQSLADALDAVLRSAAVRGRARRASRQPRPAGQADVRLHLRARHARPAAARTCSSSSPHFTAAARRPTSFYAALTGATPLQQFMNPENIGRIIGAA